jgi:hypothetical protein
LYPLAFALFYSAANKHPCVEKNNERNCKKGAGGTGFSNILLEPRESWDRVSQFLLLNCSRNCRDSTKHFGFNTNGILVIDEIGNNTYVIFHNFLSVVIKQKSSSSGKSP